MQNVFNWGLFVATINLILSTLCFLISSSQAPSREQKIVQTLSFFVVILFIGYYGSASAVEKSFTFLCFINKILYFAACNIYFFAFILFTTLLKIKIPKAFFVFLGIWTLFLTILTITFDQHHFLYKSITMVEKNGIWGLKKEYNWGHTLFFLTLIFYVLAYFVVFLKTKATTWHIRLNKIFLFLMMLIPTLCWCIESVYKSYGHTVIFSFVPIGMIISDFTLLFLVIIQKFCDITQLANNQVVESTNDAVIVTDSANVIREMNPVAKQIFVDIAEQFEKGKSVVFKDYLQILLRNRAFEYTEINGRYYKPSSQRLMFKGVCQGYVYFLKDHTAEHAYIYKLDSQVEEKTQRISIMQENMIMAVSTMMEGMSHYTSNHLERTSEYTGIIAEQLLADGRYTSILNDQYIKTLRQIAPLHDIGKFYVDPHVLNSDRHLSPQEQDDIKKHTVEGYKIVKKIMPQAFDELQLRLAEEITLYHHERWDGTGYPEQKKGEEIPLSARILAVSDVFDALSSERPYKEAYNLDKAFAMILEESGTHFDPLVVDSFFAARKKIESSYKKTYHG